MPLVTLHARTHAHIRSRNGCLPRNVCTIQYIYKKWKLKNIHKKIRKLQNHINKCVFKYCHINDTFVSLLRHARLVVHCPLGLKDTHRPSVIQTLANLTTDNILTYNSLCTYVTNTVYEQGSSFFTYVPTADWRHEHLALSCVHYQFHVLCCIGQQFKKAPHTESIKTRFSQL